MYWDYFEYLIKISWPALCGLFLIYLFLGIRLFALIKNTTEKPCVSKQIIIISRLVLTVAVLAVYTHMFILNFGEWAVQPALGRGEVRSLEIKQGKGQEEYYLTMQSGEEIVTLRIDSNVYGKLKTHDLLEIGYLPSKKEVFWCTLLTQQAETDI